MSNGRLSVGPLDGLIRDRDRLRREARPGECFIGSEVEVDLALAHEGPLRLDGLLHLHEHLGPCPNFVGGLDDRRFGVLIEVVGEAAAQAGTLFDEDVMPSLREHLRARWR